MPRPERLLIYGEPNLEELSHRAKRFGFSNTMMLEHLWWDYEFVGQLQSLEESLILRGGATTQLYVELPLQRGSIDVDFITSIPLDQIKRKVDSLVEKFTPLQITIEEYTPHRPVAGLEQATYHVHFPKLTGSGGTRRIIVDLSTSGLNEGFSPVPRIAEFPCPE